MVLHVGGFLGLLFSSYVECYLKFLFFSFDLGELLAVPWWPKRCRNENLRLILSCYVVGFWADLRDVWGALVVANGLVYVLLFCFMHFFRYCCGECNGHYIVKD